VLVPTFHGDHEHHDASLAVFRRFAKQEACCSAHSLAETYATLTGLPGRHRVAADQAMLFLETIRERLTLIPLTEEDYATTIDAAARARVVGGGVYDALIARCALKAKAEVLYTWNVSDFRRLGPEVAERVRTP
jgi:predicted nucleic acid-binding protein